MFSGQKVTLRVGPNDAYFGAGLQFTNREESFTVVDASYNAGRGYDGSFAPDSVRGQFTGNTTGQHYTFFDVIINPHVVFDVDEEFWMLEKRIEFRIERLADRAHYKTFSEYLAAKREMRLK